MKRQALAMEFTVVRGDRVTEHLRMMSRVRGRRDRFMERCAVSISLRLRAFVYKAAGALAGR